ncbi:GRF1-interacting factor [Trifolium repens]|nr:GRF1-interacting factor [Trifolium repens]
MLLLSERNCQLIRDIPEEIKTLAVYGDQLRIQQLLAGFLMNVVPYAPFPDDGLVAEYLAQLQKNLMYLAAIPDAQPQIPALPPQMALHPSMQQGFYMQHPQTATMAQQRGEASLDGDVMAADDIDQIEYPILLLAIPFIVSCIDSFFFKDVS